MKRLLCAALAALLLLPGCGAAPAYDPAAPHAPVSAAAAPEEDPSVPKYVALTFDTAPRPAARPACWTVWRSTAPGPPSLWWAARP